MIGKLKPKSEFSRNVLTLMTGTTIAQAIPIAISPILTRIYSPTDFGVIALFMAIVSIFGSIANGRYELAIMLPKKDEDAINIFALGFIITTVISLILLIFVIMFHNYFINLLNNDKIGIWLYFIPITVFFVGFFNILNYFNTRKKAYKSIANAKITKSIILAVVQLSIGFIKQGATGLVTGQILSQISANWQLFKIIIKDKILLSYISLQNILIQAKKYKNFPKFSLLGALSNILSKQLLNILISIFFNVTTLGFYTLVQRILGLPSALIGGSIGQVFFQKATEEKNNTGQIKQSYLNTLKNSIFTATIIFGILYLSIEKLFYWIFGSSWEIAGVYAKIVIPFFAIRFIYATVSTTYSIFNKLKLELLWQISMLIGIGIIFYFTNKLPFIDFLYYLNFYLTISYIISILFTYKLVYNTEKI